MSEKHQLKLRWSANAERAEIEQIVKGVMEGQQYYAIEKKHQVQNDGKEPACSSCRFHAPQAAAPRSDASDTIPAMSAHSIEEESAPPIVFTKLGCTRWTFRNADHQVQALTELAEFQVAAMSDRLAEEDYSTTSFPMLQ